MEKAPFLLLAIASCVVTLVVQQKGGAISTLESVPLGDRLANAVVSYLRYTGKVFWPHNLAVYYPRPESWPAGWVAGAALFLVALLALAVRARRTQPYFTMGWLWFLGMLVPVIGLVQVGGQAMADRYTYLPSIGIFIMVAWGAPELLARWRQSPAAAGVLGSLALTGCLAMTFAQVKHWKDSGSLFRQAISATRNNYLAYNNLGFFLYNRGEVEAALTDYEEAVRINPNFAPAQNNLGHALTGMGKNAEAIPHFETALRVKPAFVEAHNNLGNALMNEGRTNEAIAQYQAALQIQPDNEDAYNNLGAARALQGRWDEAAQLLSTAVRLKPSDPHAHSNLGTVLAAQHKLDEAAEQFRIALQLNPADAQAGDNLGDILSEQGRLNEAAEAYRAALKANAADPETHFRLGLVQQRQGRADEAKSHFTEALRLKPDYPEARRQLESLGGDRGR